MNTISPIEMTTQYATTVINLTDAWSFVMEHIDKVGTAPSISISPVWTFSNDKEDPEQHFEVVVSGMVEVSPGDQ